MTINVRTQTSMNAMMEVVEVYEKESRLLCVAALGFVVSVVDMASGMTICQKIGYPDMTYQACIEHVKTESDRLLKEHPDWALLLEKFSIINPDLISTFNDNTDD